MREDLSNHDINSHAIFTAFLCTRANHVKTLIDVELITCEIPGFYIPVKEAVTPLSH
jgi:hypothetical protein